MEIKYIIKNLMLITLLSMTVISVQASEILRVLLHVTSSSRASHQVAIGNAVGLLKTYGKDNVIVEIVANGPGIAIANSKNVFKKKVASLMDEGVRISVCNTSLNMLRQKNGDEIPLVDGVIHVGSGIIRVVELQKQGYFYIHP